MYMSNFYTLNKRLKECHNDMDFLKKNGITVDIVKAERRRMDAAAKAETKRREEIAKVNAASNRLGADAVLQDILHPPRAGGGRKTRRKRRRKKKKSRRKKKTRRRRKKRKTKKKRR